MLCAAVALRSGLVGAAPQKPAGGPNVQTLNDLIQTYCGDCHNDQLKRGSVSFDQFDIAKAGDHAALVERMIRKLQAGMMPPPGQ